MSYSVKNDLNIRSESVSLWLESCLKDMSLPNGLRTAMEYSLMAGGKRVRPVLCLASAAAFTDNIDKIMPFACAIECIHTYSLIHDDLPAMDDDDLRRGKPSSHKQFNEATAILAGDALLTDAFLFMSQIGIEDKNGKAIPAERVLRAIKEAAYAAGSCGMVGGQFLDIDFTLNNEDVQNNFVAKPDASESEIGIQALRSMHAMKTGAIIAMACTSGAILAGAEDKDVEAMREYGKAFGAAFQIVDDILDIVGNEKDLGKPVGSDEDMNKITYPSLLGLQKSRDLAQKYTELAVKAIEPYSGAHIKFLRELAKLMLKRVS